MDTQPTSISCASARLVAPLPVHWNRWPAFSPSLLAGGRGQGEQQERQSL